MSSEIGSIQPNPYLFNIENRKKRKAKLAHEIGAGAICLKCGDKCSGFQLHFWRKICQNCRCSKDDHEVDEEDEDIGKIVIGKLFERPIRTKEEEQQYSYGANLEIVNEATGLKENLKFDWVPPGVADNVAKRYMEMLPPEKRPVAGSEAAKQRRRQLEQQIPLYDMDESERCENLEPEELQNFQKYIDNVRNLVAGQASITEIVPAAPKLLPTKQPQCSFSELPPQLPPRMSEEQQSNTFNNNYSLLPGNREQELHSVPDLTNSFGAFTVDPLYASKSRGPTPYEPIQVQDSSLTVPVEPIASQHAHPKGFRSVSPQNRPSNLNQLQPSLKHLTAPQPYVAKSYDQNVVPEQYSANLTKKIHKLPPPQNNVIYQTAVKENPHYESTGSSLPNFKGRDGGEFYSSTAIQAPYASQRDTLQGPVIFAEESNVNVLLPQESKMLSGHSNVIQSAPGVVFSCQLCEQDMIPGDVAVICERAGPGKYWHPQCFVCITCNELLADLIYFYKDGQVFCGRHYTQAADIPRCKACDELIFGGSWTRADGFDWHLQHYCCFVCDTPLAGNKYVPDDKGIPYCLTCHMSFKAKMCETCECKISPNEPRAGYRGYFYHATPECFCCFNCQLAMIGKRFKMAKNWIFCSQDCIDTSNTRIINNPNPKEKTV